MITKTARTWRGGSLASTPMRRKDNFLGRILNLSARRACCFRLKHVVQFLSLVGLCGSLTLLVFDGYFFPQGTAISEASIATVKSASLMSFDYHLAVWRMFLVVEAMGSGCGFLGAVYFNALGLRLQFFSQVLAVVWVLIPTFAPEAMIYPISALPFSYIHKCIFCGSLAAVQLIFTYWTWSLLVNLKFIKRPLPSYLDYSRSVPSFLTRSSTCHGSSFQPFGPSKPPTLHTTPSFPSPFPTQSIQSSGEWVPSIPSYTVKDVSHSPNPHRSPYPQFSPPGQPHSPYYSQSPAVYGSFHSSRQPDRNVPADHHPHSSPGLSPLLLPKSTGASPLTPGLASVESRSTSAASTFRKDSPGGHHRHGARSSSHEAYVNRSMHSMQSAFL